MMNPWVRRSLIGAGLLLVAAASAVAVGAWRAERLRERVVEVPALAPVTLAADASRERGRYLYSTRGCADCHGADGAGKVFVDSDNGLKLRGAHIAPGAGSAIANYAMADWDRVVRHGVKRNGRPALIMPSEDYNRLTDADLAALVAYVTTLPPVTGAPALIELPLPVRVLYGFGAITDAAAKIDHRLPPSVPVSEGVTVAHGQYVAAMCQGCHGPGLEGGPVPGGPPDWPAAARLRSGTGSVMADRYAQPDAMMAMFRTGKRPDGSAVKVMPFDSLAKLSDTDLRALHLYLKSL
jgi:mono/diheme cytochrome c family protein